MTYEIESKVNVSNDGSNYNDNEKDNVNLDEKDKIGYEVNRETDEVVDVNYKGMEIPTEDEMINLRKVADTVPFHVFIIVLVEFAERFSYYSCSGPFQNYIENKLPNGSTTGASVNDGTPGVMGLGQQTSTGLNQFFSFFCYITPILGSIIADVKLGRFRTICVFTVVYLLGLIILTLTSIPQAISTVDNGTNSAPFAGLVVAIILIGLGAGGIKSNISILLCDQIKSDVPYIKVTKQGERVVVDPNLTVSKLMAAFYFTINVGSLASLCSTTSERKIGEIFNFFLIPIFFTNI